jgi:hypothetical protein
MKMPWIRIGLASATIAIFALPHAAMAEYYVPPSNSAATQYTEAFPTAGGQKQVGKGGQKDDSGPAAVLGARNAHRLDAHGPEGRAAAEVAAETAPAASMTTDESASGGARPESNGGNGQGGGAAESEAGQGSPSGNAVNQPDNREVPGSSEINGSSGLGSVISEATGTSSSGSLGALLPLAILAALAWAIAYLIRHRKKPAHS